MEKTTVFNLIILDESGSMSDTAAATISGCNETIRVAQNIQREHAEGQRSFMSIYAFQSDGPVRSRYLCKNISVEEARAITGRDYSPYGMTPLYDAVGSTLADLRAVASTHEDAVCIVTIITDGYENSSRHYDLRLVRKMIAGLKELGWTFNFIGANIDVDRVSADLNIDRENVVVWEQTEKGTEVLYSKISDAMQCEASCRFSEELPDMSIDQKKQLRKARAKNFFKK